MAGILDFLNSGRLFGLSPSYGGTNIPPEALRQINSRGLLNLGLGLIGNSGQDLQTLMGGVREDLTYPRQELDQLVQVLRQQRSLDMEEERLGLSKERLGLEKQTMTEQAEAEQASAEQMKQRKEALIRRAQELGETHLIPNIVFSNDPVRIRQIEEDLFKVEEEEGPEYKNPRLDLETGTGYYFDPEQGKYVGSSVEGFVPRPEKEEGESKTDSPTYTLKQFDDLINANVEALVSQQEEGEEVDALDLRSTALDRVFKSIMGNREIVPSPYQDEYDVFEITTKFPNYTFNTTEKKDIKEMLESGFPMKKITSIIQAYVMRNLQERGLSR